MYAYDLLGYGASEKRLHARIPGSKLQLIPGAGHFPQEDAAAAVADRLDRFLSTPA